MSHPVILTFDVEDWFHLICRRYGMLPDREQRARLRGQMRRVLDLLDEFGAHATFFTLGITAESFPDLVEAVVARGHEIASHGYGHRVIQSMERGEFERDVRASIEVLKKATGVAPQGYRAPEFSIVPATLWALDVLLEAGFRYDSSVFPFHGPRYGMPSAELKPGYVSAPSGGRIFEVPLAIHTIGARRLPVAGGGYWRAMPQGLIRRIMNDIAASRSPVLYFHPAEFDPDLLWVANAGWSMTWLMLKQNVRRTQIPEKLRRIMSAQRCVSIAEYLGTVADEAATA